MNKDTRTAYIYIITGIIIWIFIFIFYGAFFNFLFAPRYYRCITTQGEIVYSDKIWLHDGYVTCTTQDGTVTQIHTYKEISEEQYLEKRGLEYNGKE